MARILFVTARLPFPPREGHQLRSWHLLRAASRRHQVHLLSLQRAEDPRTPPSELLAATDGVTAVPLPSLREPRTAWHMARRWLQQRQPLLNARYVTTELTQRFSQHAVGADLVHLDILAVAGLLPAVPRGVPVVLNQHNVESQLVQARVNIERRLWRRFVLRSEARRLERFEREACERAQRVLACSPQDAEKLRVLAPRAAVRVVPNGVDLDYFNGPHPDQEDDESLVFVGQMSWFPNRDGILWFMDEVMPRILARRRVHLRVIGHRHGVELPKALEGHVEFTGFVDDLRPLVRRAAVVVVPLRAGSGTRLKVLEAMAMGKAIVSTPIGAEGIDLRHDHDVLLAEPAQAFADAVIALLDDRARRQRLGRNARNAAERDYGWEAIGRGLLEIYDDLLGTRAPSAVGAALDAG